MPSHPCVRPALGGLVLALAGVALSACHRDPDPPAQVDAVGQAVQVAIARYEAVSRQGTPAEKCAEAGRVADAQARAHRDAALAEWKAHQAADCSAVLPAGLSDT